MQNYKRVLTLIGDANDINAWSNIPYFFLKTGQELGFLDVGLPLKPEKLRIQRIIWNLAIWMRTGERGGFQYTPFFLKQLFAQADLGHDPFEIISCFPLLPPSPWSNNWKVNYYIDSTLRYDFNNMNLPGDKIINSEVRKAARKQEVENFKNAERIICMSSWVANEVVQDYGISASKVHVEVIVAGPSESESPKHPLMTSVGFIDKAKNLEQFVELVRSFHFGCLFSQSEPFGISNRECLRLGVPVIANRIGGIPAAVPDGLGFLFEPKTSPEEVVDLLESFVKNPSKYYDLRQRIAERAEEFSWQQTVHKFIQIWQGSKEFSYDQTS